MYDKFAFNDPEGLPDWFTSEEKKHRFRRPPEVSKELVAMYKERQKEANVKTIKKIAEAKARKKRKAAKKMESARKAAEGVLNQEDVSAKNQRAYTLFLPFGQFMDVKGKEGLDRRHTF